MAMRQTAGLWGGITAFGLMLLLPVPDGLTAAGQAVAAVAVLMAVWWIAEALPLAATALLPVILFPLLGVVPADEVTSAYSHHLIFLFLGGFMIAVTLERWDLHRRLALQTINLVGSSPVRLLLGFMLATAFLSMWISNTATVMMMVPIAAAVAGRYAGNDKTADHRDGLASALMLGVAYSWQRRWECQCRRHSYRAGQTRRHEYSRKARLDRVCLRGIDLDAAGCDNSG